MVKGSIVELVIPFKEDNSIDYDELKAFLEFQINNNTDGILLSSIVSQLTADECFEVAKYISSNFNDRLKLIIDISDNNPRNVVSAASKYNEMNISSYLVNAPNSNIEGLLKYYRYIADRLKHPIILGNTDNMLLNDELVKLLSYHPNVCGIRDISKDIEYKARLSYICNDTFLLYIANDLIMLPSLALNVGGVVSVIGNAFPKEVKLIYSSFFKDIKIARLTYKKIYSLIEDIQSEIDGIGIKYLLYVMGFNVRKLRLPYAEASINLRRTIEEHYLELVEEE